MRSEILTASFVTAQAVAGAGTSLQERQSTGESDCQDVHVFLARGNNEPYPGRQGVLAAAICEGVDSCDYEDIEFDNPLESVYCEAVEEGAEAGLKQITAYNKRCPDSNLVVSGYSQGGHVVGDVLGGGGGTFFEDCVQGSNEGLDPESAPGNKIVAALIFGDVRHTAGQSYNVLTGAEDNGLFPRSGQQLADLNQYADVLQAFCPETDPICAGGDEAETHLNYFQVYTDRAALWVQEKVKMARGDSSSSSTASSASSTAQASSTEDASSTTAESSAEASASSSSTASSSADDTATATGNTRASPTTDSESEDSESNDSGDDNDDDSSATRAAKSPLALGLALFVAHILMS